MKGPRNQPEVIPDGLKLGLFEQQNEDWVITLFSFPPQRRQWQPTPVLLPGKSCGRRSLVGCSPWGRKESDTTERLHFHFSLSFTGEGNGNPFQCSCLENPRDGEPGGLPSMGSNRVGHDWHDLEAAAAVFSPNHYHVLTYCIISLLCVCFYYYLVLPTWI